MLDNGELIRRAEEEGHEEYVPENSRKCRSECPNDMTTDTSERGLERLICTALTGDPCDPHRATAVSAGPQATITTTTASTASTASPSLLPPHHQAIVHRHPPPQTTTPTAESSWPACKGEINKRGTIDVLRGGIKITTPTNSPSSTAPPSAERESASDLVGQPLKVLCELRGWKTARTVLQCYQRADEDWLRKAFVEYREVGPRSNYRTDCRNRTREWRKFNGPG